MKSVLLLDGLKENYDLLKYLYLQNFSHLKKSFDQIISKICLVSLTFPLWKPLPGEVFPRARRGAWQRCHGCDGRLSNGWGVRKALKKPTVLDGSILFYFCKSLFFGVFQWVFLGPESPCLRGFFFENSCLRGESLSLGPVAGTLSEVGFLSEMRGVFFVEVFKGACKGAG